MTEGMTKDELIEQFKGNKILKYSTAIVGVIVAIVLIYIVYNKFIYEPNNEQSKSELAHAIMLMEKDSTSLAIEEFENIVSEFGRYEGGQLARYSLGNLYFKEGRFDEALDVLKKVKLNDAYLMTLAIGAIGDCYSELEDYEQAVSNYVRAAQRIENELTTPNFYFKAAMNAEEAGDFAKAKEYYEIIKDNYLTFASQKSIEKYITRAGAKIVK
jgi:tetratricopeptide (TPR) repeat protein